MTERTTISIRDEVFEEAKAAKGDRTWDELVLDGAHALETDGREDEGQDERHAQALTADDLPMIKNAVAGEVENRLTRR